MIREISYIISDSHNPYENIALEKRLLEECREEECILYLWQNKRTVVIGKNQNAWKECQVENLEKDGGHLARRLSGGGAVYHDMGNLNFTFLVRKDNYDLAKQLQVIIEAVNGLGVEAAKSGRNDILADGRKFSGNAFYKQGDHYYHHGTLMVDVDTKELSKYLTVSTDKLKSKGVDSVKSRVVNLKALNPNITIESLTESLIKAFEQVYGLESGQRSTEELSANQLNADMETLSSWDWKFGRKINFQHELSGRTEAGGVTLQLQVDAGIITDLVVYSDAMDDKAAKKISDILTGSKYTADVLDRALAVLGEEKW